jgi:hypothetical protein
VKAQLKLHNGTPTVFLDDQPTFFGCHLVGYMFDARNRKIVDMRQAGIVDSVLVLKKALEIAVSGAAMALTTDVIVHHRRPEISIEP